MKTLEEEIKDIQIRNQKVEAEKAWEVSIYRKTVITIITYLFMTFLFSLLGVEKPFVNSLIPTFGYLLSTLSISILKKYWIKYVYKKDIN